MTNDLEQLRTKHADVFKALKRNADKCSQIRRHLILNTQARKLLVEEFNRLEKEIALLDGRLTKCPSNKPIEIPKNPRFGLGKGDRNAMVKARNAIKKMAKNDVLAFIHSNQ